jgi:uncharacterized protein YndB with AHSA1/START domain
MIRKVLIGLVILVVAFVVIVAMQPSDFRVERSATIAAPAEVVFAQVNDLRAWEAWSPWAKRDPKMSRTFEGPPAGTGARHGWAGNQEVGEGRMTITESRPNELIHLRLEFIKPFACVNDVEFTFTPQDQNTSVQWSLWGKNNFVGKAMGLFMNMDKMIGGDFEAGLSGIKAVAEAAPRS